MGKLSTPGSFINSLKASAGSLPTAPYFTKEPLLPTASTPTGSPAPMRKTGGKSSAASSQEVYVSTVVDYLRENFTAFKSEWDAQTAERRATHLRLIAERLAETAPAGAPDELDSIANLRDFAQFKNMGTIRGGRAPMMTAISGRTLKELLASVSSEFDPNQPASAQFRQSSEQLSDVVVALIVLAHSFSRGEGTSTELIELMSKLLQLLKKVRGTWCFHPPPLPRSSSLLLFLAHSAHHCRFWVSPTSSLATAIRRPF